MTTPSSNPADSSRPSRDELRGDDSSGFRELRALAPLARGWSEHRDVEDIYQQLRKNNINVSRATLYRTIDVLVKNKMVRKMDVGEGKSLYEPRLDDDHHDHMICVDTGKIIEFYDEELETLQETIAKKHGYKIVRHVHQLFVKKIK